MWLLQYGDPIYFIPIIRIWVSSRGANIMTFLFFLFFLGYILGMFTLFFVMYFLQGTKERYTVEREKLLEFVRLLASDKCYEKYENENEINWSAFELLKQLGLWNIVCHVFFTGGERMKIEIRYEAFNNEFQADIEINPDVIKYVASDNIKTLFDEIYEIAWNFRNSIQSIT